MYQKKSLTSPKTSLKYGKKSKSKYIYEGIVDVTRSGNAFVIVEGLKKDILVISNNLSNARHKDKVKVEIIKHSPNRSYGKIIQVIKKAHTSLMGRIVVENNLPFFKPNSDYKINNLFDIVNIEEINVQKDSKHKILAEIIETSKNEVRILKVLSVSEEDVFMLRDILSKHDFEDGFSDNVQQSVQALKIDIATELNHRKDFREVTTLTIDPIDAKDFDDALSIQTLPNKHIQIGIHIADVSHFVKYDSDIDKEAYQKATSVYMPGFVSPMLPQYLSNHLCSLVPNEDRLTFSVIVELHVEKNHINIIRIEFAKTIINSNKRFTYDEVQDIIENGKGDYEKEILILNMIAQNLRNERIKKGSIKFASAEISFVLDKNNFPIGVKIKDSKESHQLVEEFMLLANKEVAKLLYSYEKQNVFFPYRVHDQPDEKKMDMFNNHIKKMGFKINLTDKANLPSNLNAFLDTIRRNPESLYLEKLAIRSMAKAQYTTQNIGHYGLGFKYYTHFTSPIRRYPDILTHRTLFYVINKEPKPIFSFTKKAMEQFCMHANQKETDAVEAERDAIKYKQVQYMSKYIGQEFGAIITGVSGWGAWAETLEHRCEGTIKIADLLLIDDFYFKQEAYALIGKKTKRTITIGQKVKIQVMSANVDNKELVFLLI